MTDPSEKNLNEMARVQEQLDHHNLWQLENRINEVLAQLGLDLTPRCRRSPAAGCVKPRWVGRWSAIRAYCYWMNRLTIWISKLSTGWKGFENL